MNVKAIRQSPPAQDSLQRKDCHQAVLDVAYADWQQRRDASYGEMVDKAAEKYGKAAKLFVLLGKFEQQVCNGGHIQYLQNGYADGKGSCLQEHNADIGLHQEMVHLFREFKLAFLPHGKVVLEILESFRVNISVGNGTGTCSECGGSGERERGEECGNCGGSGEEAADGSLLNENEISELDDRYYAINEAWMAELNQHIGQWFATGQDPFANEAAPEVPKTCLKPRLKLTGTDGNAYAILGRATEALKGAGFPDAIVQEYLARAKSGNYDQLLAATCEYCQVG